MVQLILAAEIPSKKMKEGTAREFLVVNNVEYQGVVVILCGSPVEAQVTWCTGKGIVGKSATMVPGQIVNVFTVGPITVTKYR